MKLPQNVKLKQYFFSVFFFKYDVYWWKFLNFFQQIKIAVGEEVVTRRARNKQRLQRRDTITEHSEDYSNYSDYQTEIER